MKLNGCHGGNYVEPYAGGGGVALNLLASGVAGHIHLNDLNQSIHAFWHSVLHQNAGLCERIEKTSVTVDEWHRQRAVQEQAETANILDLGFSTFFLNRTSRSGIIHKSGIIGGLDQTGKWKIDARYNKQNLIERIRSIGASANRISLTQMDAADFVQEYVPSLAPQTLIYFDPPYFLKGQGLHQNHYKPVDHAEIAGLIQNIKKQSWLVSYDNQPEIKELYKRRKQLVFSLSYSAQRHYEGQEVFIYKDNLIVPETEAPSTWKAA